MKDLMTLFGIVHGVRYTESQKKAFQEALAEHFKKAGFQGKKQRKGNITNLIFGDIAAARTVFVIPYDTPQRYYLPKVKYYPSSQKKNLKVLSQELLFKTAAVAGVGVICVAVLLLARQLDPMFKTLLWITGFVGIVIALNLFNTIPNPVNFSLNSAGIALAADLAIRHKHPKTVAFVFVDGYYKNYEGIKMYLSSYGTQQQRHLFLECLGEGDTLFIASDASLKQDRHPYIKALSASQGSVMEEDRAVFETDVPFIKLYRGFIEGDSGVVYHTHSKHDYHVDMDFLEMIRDSLLKL